MKADLVGWLATAVFVTSYFTKQQTTLRRIQGVGAGLWMLYGVLIHSLPVIVANLIVAGVALVSTIKFRPSAP